MVELKVWVEGIQRIVCGVTEETTCQDVVYALAHATGRTGRFTLTERWRNNERLLVPQENPLKVLMKWGEYSNDVQFILQYSGASTTGPQSNNLNVTSPSSSPSKLHALSPADRNKDIRRSLTFASQRRSDNVGIVKGIPKNSSLLISPETRNDSHIENRLMEEPPASSPSQYSKACGQTPIKSNEGSQTHPPSYQQTMAAMHHSRTPPSYRDPPVPCPPHLRALPPYREPPPPTHNASKVSPQQVSREQPPNIGSKVTPKRNLYKEYQTDLVGNEPVVYSSQYRDLVRLINYQRDKLSAQQVELTKYDAEIMYWESKTKEHQIQMEALSKDAARVDAAIKHADEQLRSFGSIEDDLEVTKQQDRTLRSELTLLRSKLANCETELLLSKNKIRLLMDEIHMEQRILARESEERNHIERSMLSEVDRLQTQVDQAKHDAEMAAQIGDSLRKEVACLEATITEKKRQVEKLVSDMKEANLQSLAISPPEELRLILEGPHKPGSARKMVGSPRQLENAVPTSKNPHGVWV